MNQRTMLIISVVVAVVATALAIYLTPLRHFTLISPTMHEIDPSDFYADYSKNPDDYVFIDVRSPTIYASAHAKGSINIPIENLFDEHYRLPKYGKKIALICTTGRLAGVAYGYLENWGFQNLMHIEGGVANWSTEGLPIEGKNVGLPKGAPDEHQ